MRLHRTLVGAACGTALALGVAAAPAQAARTPAMCGFEVCLSTTNGSATLYFDRYGASAWKVCDDAPDGRRAMAEVRGPSGQVLRLRTADGFGSCSPEQVLHPEPSSGSVLSLKVWVQKGSGGTPQYHGYDSYRW
ncbi:hypothetical protein [Streptomyces syringium]|uniref:Peptidase inhibitor family I36 n=1 Tax=Streptomyces syringium TaxID=76729 RepID=A0ABS4XWF2_9ACTN|nr:hypothetical protein [Streptomyces syringium]MBP2400587.1 hypothetical protein [Streptomyces syringium]